MSKTKCSKKITGIVIKPPESLEKMLRIDPEAVVPEVEGSDYYPGALETLQERGLGGSRKRWPFPPGVSKEDIVHKKNLVGILFAYL